MKDVFEYMDYREFLRDFYEDRKANNYFYSFRYLAGKVGMDHSLLVKVLLGKRHITTEMTKPFAEICGLSGKAEQYFAALVQFGKARSESESRLYLDKMLSFKGLETRKVEASRFEYFQKWYYSAVRAVIDICEFKDDYRLLGARLNPSISADDAQRAVALLAELGFIVRDQQGFWRVKDAHVTTGESWRSRAVRAYQREAILLSAGSVERDPPETRDIASLTMSVDQACFDDIKEILRQAREQIKKRVDEIGAAKRDRVYQLNLQFIPLTRSDVRTRSEGRA